tara:strand:+ start:122 stop:424 length:303 start_codon:yes stop_codon:yes gene_type:complete
MKEIIQNYCKSVNKEKYENRKRKDEYNRSVQRIKDHEFIEIGKIHEMNNLASILLSNPNIDYYDSQRLRIILKTLIELRVVYYQNKHANSGEWTKQPYNL